MTKQILKLKANNIVVLDHSEHNIYKLSKTLNHKKINLILGDIKDQSLVEQIIKKFKINYIFHTAAYKHVNILEQNVHVAFKNNILGTYSLIKSIKNKKINFIFISTDKAVNPKNILGATKRIGEILVNYYSLIKDYSDCKFITVRFGNVIGSDGSALPYFLRQIKSNLPISLTDKNMERYFMTVSEACSLVLQSSTLNIKQKILFLDMGKPIKILHLIKKMFNIFKSPNQKLKLNIIGNKFNEKISEKLFHNNKVEKTKFKKIYAIETKLPNENKISSILHILNENINLYDDQTLQRKIFKISKF